MADYSKIPKDIQAIYDATILSATGTGTALLTTGDVSAYRGAAFSITIGGAETVSLVGYYDVAATQASHAIMVRKTDGTYAAASALASGTYYFNNTFAVLKFTKSAAVESCTITGAMTAMPTA